MDGILLDALGGLLNAKIYSKKTGISKKLTYMLIYQYQQDFLKKSKMRKRKKNFHLNNNKKSKNI